MVAQEICQGLAKRGHEVWVLTAHHGSLPLTQNLNGVEVVRVRSGRVSPYQAGLGAMAGFVAAGLLAGQRMVRHSPPDLIHVHFAVPSGPVAWALSRRFQIPYVLTAHLGDVPGGVPEKTSRWFRWIAPLTPPIWKDAAQVTAVSEFTRRLAGQHYPVNIEVIPNGVDLQDLDPGVICAGSPPQIIFAGRFTEQKNPLQVVRTLSRLQDLDWRCLMVGDGMLYAEVEAEIERLGMKERFSLPGWVTPEEVIECFRRSDILFMPSHSEGLPVVGVRALALGLAVTASRVGGFIDLVEDGVNGRLVEPVSPEGYERALRELLVDRLYLQRQREASRLKAQAFDLETVVSAYEELFQRVLAKRGTE